MISTIFRCTLALFAATQGNDASLTKQSIWPSSKVDSVICPFIRKEEQGFLFLLYSVQCQDGRLVPGSPNERGLDLDGARGGPVEDSECASEEQGRNGG